MGRRIGTIFVAAGATTLCGACALPSSGLGDLADTGVVTSDGALDDSAQETGVGDDAGFASDVRVGPAYDASVGGSDATSPAPPTDDGSASPTGSDDATVPGLPDATAPVTPDATAPVMPDATTPRPPLADDAGDAAGASCGAGVACNGSCTHDSDCTACTGAPLLCRATGACVSDCSGCPARPVACYACNGKHGDPLGTCEPNNPADYCLDGDYSHAYSGGAAGARCACQTSKDCPGDNQLCMVNPGNGLHVCYSCGEAKNRTQGATCKDGNSCNASAASCQ